MTKTHNYAADHPAEYDQGRHARLSSISKDEAPYDAGTDAQKAWQAGFDDAEGEAARNETSGPAETTKATGQIATVAHANTAKK